MTPITDEVVDRCAEAAYGPLWIFASDKVKDEWRAIARAVLTEALRQPPPAPLEGQDPLIA